MTKVVAVECVTPWLRQITFGALPEDFVSVGGDQFLYVLLPRLDEQCLTIGTDFSWQQYEQMAPSQRPRGAYYSVRAWRPEAGEIDMWFVLHGGRESASTWAENAAPGQPAALWGPRRIYDAPPGTGSYLFVADETGFGAVSAVLDEVLGTDDAAMVTVVAECDGVDSRVEFPTGARTEVVWADRSGAAPGSTAVLFEAVRDLELADDVYAFGAAESRQITEVRKYLRQARGIPAEQVSMTGYWRAS